MRIWLLDFARRHPGAAQLDGLDISLDQVPDKAWLPSNVSFYLYDIYDEPPDYLVEKYDIINVRHLTLVIKDNDPTVVIRNLLKMLSTFVLSITPNSLQPLNNIYIIPLLYVLRINRSGYD